MKNLILVLFLAIFTFSCSSKNIPSTSQNDEVFSSINSQNFKFETRHILPARGKTIFMSEDYTLNVSPEKISAHLPYFGRAYVAPTNPSEGGIVFESDNFEYNVNEGKKGRKEITIKVNNSNVVQQMFLTVFSDGTATLNVTPTNKQHISYRGQVSSN